MTTQTVTIKNPSGNTKALRITDAAGGIAPVYVSPGLVNEVSLNDAGGNHLVVVLVELAIAPNGAGGHGEE